MQVHPVDEKEYAMRNVWPKGTYQKLSQLQRIGYKPGLGLAWKQKNSPERQAAAALLMKRRREIRLQW